MGHMFTLTLIFCEKVHFICKSILWKESITLFYQWALGESWSACPSHRVARPYSLMGRHKF